MCEWVSCAPAPNMLACPRLMQASASGGAGGKGSKAAASPGGPSTTTASGAAGSSGKAPDRATACEKCQGGHMQDKIVACDRCDKGWHLFCLAPPLAAPPAGEWVCPDCRSKGEEGRGMLPSHFLEFVTLLFWVPAGDQLVISWFSASSPWHC